MQQIVLAKQSTSFNSGSLSRRLLCNRTENLGFWTQDVGFLDSEGEIDLLRLSGTELGRSPPMTSTEILGIQSFWIEMPTWPFLVLLAAA
jgi:hypothetical protein